MTLPRKRGAPYRSPSRDSHELASRVTIRIIGAGRHLHDDVITFRPGRNDILQQQETRNAAAKARCSLPPPRRDARARCDDGARKYTPSARLIMEARELLSDQKVSCLGPRFPNKAQQAASLSPRHDIDADAHEPDGARIYSARDERRARRRCAKKAASRALKAPDASFHHENSSCRQHDTNNSL